MSIDFAINAQQQFQGTAAAEQSSAAVAGSLMGQAAARVDDPMSLLADAAEELGFSADNTDEFELEERKERDKVQKGINDRVRLYEELMHKAGKRDKMNELKQAFKARGSRQAAASEAKRLFPDPSDAWVALASALEDLEAEKADPKLLDELRAALADMEESDGPAIKTGICGALEAAGFEDVGTAGELRDLYRQTVCDFGTVNDVFRHIHEKYGDISFDRAMDFLFSALGADLASDAPSMEMTHLEDVHANLSQVRLLQNAYIQCDRLVGRWDSVHNVKDSGLNAMELLGDIVALRDERFVGAMQIDRIAAKAKAPDIEHEVLFLQEMLHMTREFPVRLFDDAAGRMKVLDAVQEAVDHAIEREDAYLAQQE